MTVETGDLICTTDGNPSFLMGQFWWFIGKLIAGEVDHIFVYVGPKGRCVEAGAKGKVITFSVHDHHWYAASMFAQRNMTDSRMSPICPWESANRRQVDRHCEEKRWQKKTTSD
ncbi:MAG: hypothetical protein JW883_09730 [Deltaproteobacteria bacterium]|nr:hypothetical protein [Deltaproteobacteria bacterium]